jgi:iron complex outermembrane receptor protein
MPKTKSSISPSSRQRVGNSGVTDTEAQPSFKLRASVAAILTATAIMASGQVYAADDPKALTELQAENLRLKKEIEALKQQSKGAAAAATTQTVTPSASVAAPSAPVAAGNDGVVAFDKVIVTSRNREEIAQDVPLPVTVLGGERLDREDIKSIYDLPAQVPNLQLNERGENARKVSPSIRGLGRGGANDSMEQSVGVIVDGVTLYYSGQAWNDYVDLDRIEVLNGPQGTLMGKNTSLGAINIITKAPSFKPSSTFEVSTGQLNTLNGKFSSTGPLVDGLLAYRGTFVVDRGDGLYLNTYQSQGKSKETWRESNKLAGRLQFLLTPTEDLTARVILDKTRSDERVNTGSVFTDNGPSTWRNSVTGAESSRVVAPRVGAGTYTGGVNYGYLGRFTSRAGWFHNADGTVYQPKFNTTNIENSEARPQVTNQHGISAQVDWRVFNHTLTSISAYRYQDFDIKNGGQNGQFYIGNGGQQLWNKQVSQELRLASTPAPDKAFDYQVGLYYLNAQVYSDDPSYYGPDAGAWNATNANFDTLMGSAAGRQLLRASLDGVYQSRVTDARVQSLAAYGQTDWHLTEKATLTFGLRQTQEKKQNAVAHQLDRPGENLSTLGALLGASPAEILAAQQTRDGQVKPAFASREGDPIDASLTAWNVGPSYKINDDVLLYSSVGKGVKSGFIYFDTGATAPQTTIKPEKTLDFELGVKSLLLNNKLQLNANLYLTKIKDYQATWRRDDPATPGASISAWGNVEKISARGLELQTAYQVTNHLTLNLNGAYNKAEYETQWMVQVPEVSNTAYFDAKGQQLANVPKTTVNYGLNYQAPLAGFLGRVTLSNSYRSSVYLNDNHAQNTFQKAYTVTNLGIGLGSLNRSWEASLLVRNLFDTEYNTSASTWSGPTGSSSSANAGTANWGMPRNIQLIFKAKY